MKRWLIGCMGVGLTGLALGGDPNPPTPPAPPRADAPPKIEPKEGPAPPKVVNEAEQGEGVSLTVYNQDFAIVKERRRLDLAKGRSTLRFKDVAATIVPETVQFTTLRDADLARVVEQNYEFDLVSADKLLQKYVERKISVVTQDGETLEGTLLSFDPAQLVLKTEKGIDLVPRTGNVKDVRFSALPGGLLTRPTLVWQLDTKAAGKELVKVAYRANRMSWRVDYRARVNQTGDKLDLAGWVTVNNYTGTGFTDARVKLMAGDVNLVQAAPPGLPDALPTEVTIAPKTPFRPGFTEKSFAEYHLYELGRTITLKDQETKQIELLDVAEIPVTRKYAYRGQGTRVAVVLEFENDEKVRAGLGVPLPKGVVRVFQRDADGQLEFAGQDSIDHTPRKEKVAVQLGTAFEIVGERKQVAYRNGPNWQEMDMEIRLRNHKAQAVKVDAIEAINGRSNWQMLKQSHQFAVRDVNTLVFPLEVKADSETVLTYTIRYIW